MNNLDALVQVMYNIYLVLNKEQLTFNLSISLASLIRNLPANRLKTT
jgi:hypothetical protein